MGKCDDVGCFIGKVFKASSVFSLSFSAGSFQQLHTPVCSTVLVKQERPTIYIIWNPVLPSIPLFFFFFFTPVLPWGVIGWFFFVWLLGSTPQVRRLENFDLF